MMRIKSTDFCLSKAQCALKKSYWAGGHRRRCICLREPPPQDPGFLQLCFAKTRASVLFCLLILTIPGIMCASVFRFVCLLVCFGCCLVCVFLVCYYCFRLVYKVPGSSQHLCAHPPAIILRSHLLPSLSPMLGFILGFTLLSAVCLPHQID